MCGLGDDRDEGGRRALDAPLGSRGCWAPIRSHVGRSSSRGPRRERVRPVLFAGHGREQVRLSSRGRSTPTAAVLRDAVAPCESNASDRVGPRKAGKGRSLVALGKWFVQGRVGGGPAAGHSRSRRVRRRSIRACLCPGLVAGSARGVPWTSIVRVGGRVGRCRCRPVDRPERQGGPRQGNTGPDPVTRHPASVGRRVDLPAGERPPPGHGPGRPWPRNMPAVRAPR